MQGYGSRQHPYVAATLNVTDAGRDTVEVLCVFPYVAPHPHMMSPVPLCVCVCVCACVRVCLRQEEELEWVTERGSTRRYHCSNPLTTHLHPPRQRRGSR